MPRTVLIVEDADDLREMLVEFLDLEGFDPTAARHGAEALAILHEADTLPIAVVLDLMMPVMDGWQLCAQLRANERLAQIPVLVMSAVADRYPENDAVAVLQKPLDFDALLAALQEC